MYKSKSNKKDEIIKRIRNFGILNKLRNGVKITKIRPTKLLIKKRG